jgi:DNA-binding CsgD family transcriptional regulator
MKQVGVPTDERLAKPDIKDLFRQLLKRINNALSNSDRSPERTDGKKIMLDIQLDGVQYTLIRSPLQSARLQVHLSPRESEIVRLVAKGLPNKTIAAVLDISPWTVATHIRRVFSKLDVSSRAEMIARVLGQSLVKSEPHCCDECPWRCASTCVE